MLLLWIRVLRGYKPHYPPVLPLCRGSLHPWVMLYKRNLEEMHSSCILVVVGIWRRLLIDKHSEAASELIHKNIFFAFFESSSHSRLPQASNEKKAFFSWQFPTMWQVRLSFSIVVKFKPILNRFQFEKSIFLYYVWQEFACNKVLISSILFNVVAHLYDYRLVWMMAI